MTNSYGTLTEKWKVALAKKLAWKDGFRQDEMDDVLQEIVPVLVHFKFEPEKSNGATEETVIEAVIRKQLKFMQRCRARRQKNETGYRLMHGATDLKPAPDPVGIGPERQIGLATDVRATVAGLSSQERTVCAALADGQPRCQVAEDMGLSRYELDQIIERIAERFRDRDLDAWMQN